MNRKKLIKELNEMGVYFDKIKFYAKSPYQSKRYKAEFIGWEAWLYNDKSKNGWLLTQEDYENKEYLKDYLLSYQN